MREWAYYESKPSNQPTKVRKGDRGTERSGKTTVTRPTSANAPVNLMNAFFLPPLSSCLPR
jgi:hypothetical protein